MKYGRLTIIEGTYHRDAKYNLRANAKCDCGEIKDYEIYRLKTGKTNSCGCYNIDRIIERNTTHGMSGTGTYRSWQAMKDRCNTNGNYIRKNIEICKRWQKFENFFSDMGKRPIGMSIDRIDNHKGYSKENCRWATRTEQNNNTSQNVYLKYKGKTKTLTQWARKFDLPPKRVNDRIKKLGWSVERALET